MNETETFQHYQVLKRDDGSLWELGRGAMGVTYKAFDVNLRCHVALKVISSQYLDSETARARFLREARAAAGLRHRNVASVYHLGNDAESFFYSMEFIDGDTVESLVTTQGPLPCAQALAIVVQVARALGAAAKQGLVHRDIKPANVMVVHDDEEDTLEVKVIDFGLARLSVGGEQSGSITMGGFVGTPQYASPEQIEEKDLDVRSDIYSLGITLWYMLTGQPPFTGTVFRISSQHLTAEPPFGQLPATVPTAVRDLLAHMLQKDPANRPQTPAKLRAEAEACLGDLPAVSALSTPAAVRAPSANSVSPGTDAPGFDEGAVTVVQGPAPTAGTIFAGRYQLAELVAEGQSGKVYRAFDGRLDGRQVAVKVLHPHVRLSPQEFYHLQSDLGRLRDAPHPRLIDTLSLERIHGYKFIVMDWVNGFPLTRLLETGGPLSVRDALQFLGQASDAAGHCSSHRFHRLELESHQLLTHFSDAARDDVAPDLDAILARPVAEWPTFTLRMNALAPAREASRAASSSGARVQGRDTFTSIRGLIEGSYFRALGLLFHELLGGSNPVLDEVGAPCPLPALSEEGNAILKQALSTNPGFATEREFFFALLDASGLRAEEVGMTRTVADQPSFRVGGSAPRPSPPTSAPTAVPPGAGQTADATVTRSGAVTQGRPTPSAKPAIAPESTRTDRARPEATTARPAVAIPPANRAPAPPPSGTVESDAPTIVPAAHAPSVTVVPSALPPSAVPARALDAKVFPAGAPTVAPPTAAPEPKPVAPPPEPETAVGSLRIAEQALVPPVKSPDDPEPAFTAEDEAEPILPPGLLVSAPTEEPAFETKTVVEANSEPSSALTELALPVPLTAPYVEVTGELIFAPISQTSAEVETVDDAEATPGSMPEAILPVYEGEESVSVPESVFPGPNAAPVVETKAEPTPAPMLSLANAPADKPVFDQGVAWEIEYPPEAKPPFASPSAPVESVRVDQENPAPAKPTPFPFAFVEPTPVTEDPPPVLEARMSPTAPPMAPRGAAPTFFPNPGAKVSPPAESAPTILPTSPVARPKFPAAASGLVEMPPVGRETPPAKPETMSPSPLPVLPPEEPSSEIPAAEIPAADFAAVPHAAAASARPVAPRKKLPLIPIVAGGLAMVVIGLGATLFGHKSSTSSVRPPTTNQSASASPASVEKTASVAPSATQPDRTPPPDSAPVAPGLAVAQSQTPPPAPVGTPTATPGFTESLPTLEASPPAVPTPTPVPSVASTPPSPPANREHVNTAPTPHPTASSAPTAKGAATPARDPHHLPAPPHPTPAPKATPPVSKPLPRPGKPTPPPNDDVPGFMR